MGLLNLIKCMYDDFRLGMASADAEHEDMRDPEYLDIIDIDESERKIYS